MAQGPSKATTSAAGIGIQRANPLTEQQARLLLEEHARSGMTVSAFCLSKGLKRDRLIWWQKKFTSTSKATVPASPATRLVEVKMASESTRTPETLASPQASGLQQGPFELCLGDTRRLRVPHDFQEASLQRLLRVLAEVP